MQSAGSELIALKQEPLLLNNNCERKQLFDSSRMDNVFL